MTRSCYFWFILSRDQLYVLCSSCVVARSVCLNSTCVKNLESPFYMNLEIKIYQIKHMCYYFLFHLRSILLFYQKVTSMLVFSLTKIFHTFVCPHYAVSHVWFFPHLTAVRLSSLCFSSHWPPGVVLSLLSF